jgi:hypothetical protein
VPVSPLAAGAVMFCCFVGGISVAVRSISGGSSKKMSAGEEGPSRLDERSEQSGKSAKSG